MVNQFTSKNIDYWNLGLVPYKDAWELQSKLFQQRLDNQIKDTLILLEHPHTYTLGKIAKDTNFLSPRETLIREGISVYDIDRGGDITYHGPGQIVGYPILNLADWKKDTNLYLRGLEEVIIRTCGEFGLKCGRDDKYTGVWINKRKICAIGVKISRWISMHGFALNVNTDLEYFNKIIPCGIVGKDVTSLARELGKELDIETVKIKLVEHFKVFFGYDVISIKGDKLDIPSSC